MCPCKSLSHLHSFALMVKANLDLKIQNFRISNRTGTKSENGICHAVFLIEILCRQFSCELMPLKNEGIATSNPKINRIMLLVMPRILYAEIIRRRRPSFIWINQTCPFSNLEMFLGVELLNIIH